MRSRDEETVDQRAALEEALGELSLALEDVASEAKAVARLAGRKSARRVDLTQFHRLHRLVVRAEEAAEIAAYDLETASGEDG